MQGSNRGKENRTGAYKKELKTGERTTTYKKVPLEKGIALFVELSDQYHWEQEYTLYESYSTT